MKPTSRTTEDDFNEERLALLGILIAELRAFADGWNLSEEDAKKVAESWYSTVAEIPLGAIVSRTPTSLCEEMKRRGYSTGPQMLELWRSREGRRAEAAAIREQASQREREAMKYKSSGPGHDELLRVGKMLGWKGGER